MLCVRTQVPEPVRAGPCLQVTRRAAATPWSVTALSESDLPPGESTISLPGLFWAWDELTNAFKVLAHGESLTDTCSGLFYSTKSDQNFREFLITDAPRACQAPARSPRAPMKWVTVSAWALAGVCRTEWCAV